MRDKKSQASLGEILGKGFENKKALSMDDLPKILGEKMPEIKYDRVGKLRLINALQQRFGTQYGNVPGVRDIINHFNKELEVETIVRMNKGNSKDG